MISDAEAFEYLKIELKETVLSHPIIQRNRYLWWFSIGAYGAFLFVLCAPVVFCRARDYGVYHRIWQADARHDLRKMR